MGPVKTGLSGEACDGLCDPDHPLSGGALSPACGVSLADVLLMLGLCALNSKSHTSPEREASPSRLCSLPPSSWG